MAQPAVNPVVTNGSCIYQDTNKLQCEKGCGIDHRHTFCWDVSDEGPTPSPFSLHKNLPFNAMLDETRKQGRTKHDGRGKPRTAAFVSTSRATNKNKRQSANRRVSMRKSEGNPLHSRTGDSVEYSACQSGHDLLQVLLAPRLATDLLQKESY